MALLDRAIVRLLPAVPKPIVRRIADRYIAGEKLEDALATVARLNARAKSGTIDVLGEEITNPDEARTITSAYLDVLRGIEERGLDSNASVKPTALGLELSYELWRENIETLVRDARERRNFVRIDMEDSSTTDATLRTYRELRESGFDNVGVVLQARLRRTLDDIGALADLRPNVRICKGIYLEPESIAYTRFDEIRESFVRCLEALRETASYIGVATHDEYLIDAAKRVLRDRYEFQMLLGVREKLGDALVREGHRLRIYVPFGRQWYEYSLRRLQENPRIAGYVASDTVSRIFSRRNGSP
ncbi:MAG TPA: proline dehydrogenase family protein [Gaiellaceae bacterium]|nr:proline dehydrogenase family protein [Gaiellaceae bacterium]